MLWSWLRFKTFAVDKCLLYSVCHSFFVIFNMWNKFCFSNHRNVSFRDFQEAVVDSDFRFSVTSIEIREWSVASAPSIHSGSYICQVWCNCVIDLHVMSEMWHQVWGCKRITLNFLLNIKRRFWHSHQFKIIQINWKNLPDRIHPQTTANKSDDWKLLPIHQARCACTEEHLRHNLETSIHYKDITYQNIFIVHLRICWYTTSQCIWEMQTSQQNWLYLASF